MSDSDDLKGLNICIPPHRLVARIIDLETKLLALEAQLAEREELLVIALEIIVDVVELLPEDDPISKALSANIKNLAMACNATEPPKGEG